MTSDERQQAICDSAITEFGRLGFYGSTTAAIAHGAGCSEPMIYKHFHDKKHLLRAALARSEQLAEADIDAALDAEDPLAGWLAYIEHGDLTRYHRMICMRMLCATFPDGSDLQEHLRAGNERLLGRFSRALQRIDTREHERRAELDPDQLGWLWLGVTLAGAYGAAIDSPDRFRQTLQTGGRVLTLVLSPKGAT